MHATIGDHLVIHGHAVGSRSRRATIVEVRGPDGGPPYVVRWDDEAGDEPSGHLFFPGPDADLEPARGS
jgi:hypothetical protein